MNVNRLLFTALALLNFACINAMERQWISYAKTREEKQAEAKEEQIKRATNELIELLLSAPPASLEKVVAAGFWNKKEQNDFFKKIKELLDAGANPNEIFTLTKQNNFFNLPSGSISTVLKYAIRLEYPELVQLLLEHGANANFKQDSEPTTSTPLMLTLFGLDPDYSVPIIILLLKHRADPNIPFKDESPLMRAANYQNLPVTKLLLDHGANPNYIDKRGETALFHTNNPDIVQLLLNNGADPNIQNNDGENVLSNAVQSGSWDIVRILLDNGANINIQTRSGQTPLMLSAATVDINRQPTDGPARLFIERGAQLDIQDTEGNTALIHAVLKNNEPMVRLLLENGANPNVQNAVGQTALSIAKSDPVENQNKAIIELLKNPPPPNPIRKLI